MSHLQDGVTDLIRLHQFVTLRVNHAALIIGHIIVVEQVLTYIEVMRFDLALGVLDCAVQHARLDCLVLLHPEFLHQHRHPVGSKNAHQVIFQRKIEPGRTRVALAAGTAPELIIDTA